ncbi:hypothetical protein EV424DRAFT_1350755 [Suillus variegatus]|nr:hypothetical protein EV424DRAFT_1350755 [Suillus variegatus]
MSSQTSTSTEHLIMGCVFAPTQPNGFLEVTIKDGHNGTFTLTRPNQFFKDIADIKQYQITTGDEQVDEPHVIHVMYDRKLHGTSLCPYLVFKGTQEGQALALERKDYMTATAVIDKMMQDVPTYKEQVKEKDIVEGEETLLYFLSCYYKHYELSGDGKCSW